MTRLSSLWIDVLPSTETWHAYKLALNRPQYIMDGVQGVITNLGGVSSLLDLREACFTVGVGFSERTSGDVDYLLEAFWHHSYLTFMKMDFGDGRIQGWQSRGLGVGTKLPVYGRLYK